MHPNQKSFPLFSLDLLQGGGVVKTEEGGGVTILITFSRVLKAIPATSCKKAKFKPSRNGTQVGRDENTLSSPTNSSPTERTTMKVHHRSQERCGYFLVRIGMARIGYQLRLFLISRFDTRLSQTNRSPLLSQYPRRDYQKGKWN